MKLLTTLRRHAMLVRVRGESMHPTYHDGDLLLATRPRRLRPGAVVVFRTPPPLGDPPYRIKRLVALTPALFVRGDNPRSEDSRHYGNLTREDILGVVRLRLTRRPAYPSTGFTAATRSTVPALSRSCRRSSNPAATTNGSGRRVW